MELMSIMYRYLNRFINHQKLVQELQNLDSSLFSEKEKGMIQALIMDVQKVSETVPNEFDEIEEKRMKSINRMLDFIQNAIASNQLDKKTNLFLEKKDRQLMEDKKESRDGGKLYETISQLLVNHPLIDQQAKKMKEEEIFTFITKYISVPLPLPINQETFDALVQIGINKDDRGGLWRLAMNYENHDIDFSQIEEYFIEKRDDYYLIELLSGLQDTWILEGTIKKALATKDNVFINGCANRAIRLDLISEEERQKWITYYHENY